jgi:hypothetical protein
MERLRKPRTDNVRHASGDPVTAGDASALQPIPVNDAARDVQVIHGASVQNLALAGLTVAQARPLVETILAVNPRSPALVNGRPVRASYVIAQGDALEFVHHAGEKGRTKWSCASRSRQTASCAGRMAAARLRLH